MPHNTQSHWEQIHRMFYHSILKPQIDEEWAPNTDLYGDEDGLVVKMALAGVVREDINIDYDNGVLIVSGIRHDPTLPSEKTDRRFTQAEIEFGRFRRIMRLDVPVDSQRISAQFQNGMLLIRLPWQSETHGRRSITVVEQ